MRWRIVKVEGDIQIEKKKICLKFKVIRFDISLKKSEKRRGRSDNLFIYTIDNRRPH